MPLAPLFAAAATIPSILFVGNSFTFGALSPVEHYRADAVTDLNGEGIGGVPALFATFAEESGQPWRVSLETSPGKDLRWHWENRRALLDRRWSAVVMQDYSTLSADHPGDGSELSDYAGRFARLFRAHSPAVRLSLTATWSRPDQTYVAAGHWAGQPIQRMALDLRAAYDRARAANRAVERVNPAGEAFNCAIARGIADPNPYDGITPGQVDLWASDHYHASTAGYYLEALVVFAGVTGARPTTLGPQERAARDHGLAPPLAAALQKVAEDMVVRKRC
ncbi:PEP-CTERM sorting domain-containing protein [Sphingomonas ginkgonis]|uniref:PEP-CTERM sorting domain-containing protein n=1 Tax=Sphingomonas ginkgonis TaxID=2315330 RepID=A0A429V8P9_9SPHN|nr:PEP-CTERM sorting domain-containing protein [Sphingomonas ginkgonis]RST30227.1 PEP-CTERM sorting domain-containing protein [Sphingomonas ginkgonis]